MPKAKELAPSVKRGQRFALVCPDTGAIVAKHGFVLDPAAAVLFTRSDLMEIVRDEIRAMADKVAAFEAQGQAERAEACERTLVGWMQSGISI